MASPAAGLIPEELAQRPKHPYRAPISRCFLGKDSPEYVDDLLSEPRIRQAGYFDPIKVARLVQKGKSQKGSLLSERENMALIGIISTQLLHSHFITDFPIHPSSEIKEFNVYVNKNREGVTIKK